MPLMVVAGCAAPGMGGWSMHREIAGGQSVDIQFGKRGPVPGEDDAVRLNPVVFVLDDKNPRLAAYKFSLVEKNGKVPDRITVEDVSDDKPVFWVNDGSPRLVDDQWTFRTPFLQVTPVAFGWLNEIDNGVRVYRFTIYQSDGSKDVLYDASNYPASMKAFLRVHFGWEKPPAQSPS